MFIIPCKFNKEIFNTLNETLDSIYKYRPNDSIVVVDSFSEDDSYLIEIEKKPNVIVFDQKNKDYPPGAFAKVVLKYPNQKFYCLIHDNTSLKSNLSEFIDTDYQFHSFFNGGINVDLTRVWGTSSIGIVNYDIVSYADEIFKNTKYNTLEFGSLVPFHHFIIKSDLAKTIINSGVLSNIHVEHKTQDNAWERIFGMIFAQEGYFAGIDYIDHQDHPVKPNNYFDKKFFGRS